MFGFGCYVAYIIYLGKVCYIYIYILRNVVHFIYTCILIYIRALRVYGVQRTFYMYSARAPCNKHTKKSVAYVIYTQRMYFTYNILLLIRYTNLGMLFTMFMFPDLYYILRKIYIGKVHNIRVWYYYPYMYLSVDSKYRKVYYNTNS